MTNRKLKNLISGGKRIEYGKQQEAAVLKIDSERYFL